MAELYPAYFPLSRDVAEHDYTQGGLTGHIYGVEVPDSSTDTSTDF